ncbi:MAG: B12-binding domain-containing radical SAM protein [Geobacteraceae bacterium]|nr:B12-binding domain-containing radical SAM protein [Geobacteraceae bacterium]
MTVHPDHVLLFRPPDPLQDSALLSHTRPMNLAYLAAMLRTAGFEAVIVDYETTPYDEQHLRQLIRHVRPLAAAITCTTPTVTSAARLAAAIKSSAPEIATVVGGAHASALPQQTMQDFPMFDYLVYGEGEITLRELCIRLRDGGRDDSVKGLVFRENGAVSATEARPLITDLDSIPFPARDLIDYTTQAGHSSRGFSNKLLSTELFTSRGCPVGCSFCAIQATFGRSVRFREPLFIEDELQRMVREQRFNHVVIADDTFTLQPDRAAAISEILGRSGIASWNCDTRVNTVSLELLKTMKRCGCEKVAFGVESGSQRLLDLIGKGISVDQVRRAVYWAKQAGIRHIEGNFIIGCDPSETAGDLEMTRELITTLPWTFVSVAVIVPYPGTPVREQMLSAGLIDRSVGWDDYVIFGKRPGWRTEHFSADDLLLLQRSLTRSFYLRPSYIMSRLASIRSRGELGYWATAGASYLKWYLTGKN